VNADGTYDINHDVSGKASGTWRLAAKDEIIGFPNALILQNGPGNRDWALVRNSAGNYTLRYNDGYTGGVKVWFVDSLAVLKP